MRAPSSHKARAIAVLGTGSDVGKSAIVVALCRLFHRAGVHVAPFKAQNMSLNSFATIAGGEIGRAQALQAQAAGVQPHVDMNPILLKPESDDGSQVIVQGRVFSKMKAREYFAQNSDLFQYVQESYERLACVYEVMVIEGAGSAAEVNLRDRDIVNWRVAEMADAPVLLIANIDPGGVFAQIIGTLELIAPEERRRIRGLIVNKFRGDRTLFQDGVTFLERRTGIPVLGVVPFLRDLTLDQEDSVEFNEAHRNAFSDKGVNVAVVLLPRMSNFTDFNMLAAEPDVSLQYIRSPADLTGADVIIIPGSKNTIGDLDYLHQAGFVKHLEVFPARGGELIGVCGGYQMLGTCVSDPDNVEAGGTVAGIGLLSVVTQLTRSKTIRQVRAVYLEKGRATSLVVAGYHIHMGHTQRTTSHACFTLVHGHHDKQMTDGSCEKTQAEDGAVNHDGSVWGTYIHGLFDAPAFRRYWLNKVRQRKGLSPLDPSVSTETTRRLTSALDCWTDHVQQHVDWPSIANLAVCRRRHNGRASTLSEI